MAIFEKLQYSRLCKFLYQNKMDIWQALDDDKYACGVLLDFQKAFDTAKQRIPFSKLEDYGIREILFNLFITTL